MSNTHRNPTDTEINAVIKFYTSGQIEEARAVLIRLTRKYPNEALLFNFLGVCYATLNQTEAAFGSFESALRINPDNAEVHYNLGNTLKACDRLNASIKSYTRALDINPFHADTHINLGNAFKGIGNIEKAVSHYEHAIQINPNYTEAHCNLGNTLHVIGNLEAAISCYQQALSIDPSDAEAHNCLGNTYNDLGKTDAALSAIEQALTIKPTNPQFWASYATALHQKKFKTFNESISNYLVKTLQQPTINPNYIAPAIVSALQQHPKIKLAIKASKNDLIEKNLPFFSDQLASISLFLALLENCPIADPQIQYLLTQMRRATLNQLFDSVLNGIDFSFYYSLALHCFTNEYIFFETDEEIQNVIKLENKINYQVNNNLPIPPIWIVLLAAYRPLHNYLWAEQLQKTALPVNSHKILARQLFDIKKEQHLKTKIHQLTSINDSTPNAVKEQYEQNPYPRWINPGLFHNPKTIRENLHAINPQLSIDDNHYSKMPNILIAGCGTGQHALNSQSRFLNCTVLAIDLSLNSLSYAMRKTHELSITNINYKQADILELQTLDLQFDVIESVGVLHHLRDPLEGWRILIDLLNQNGIMKIGLYSQIARQHLIKTHDFIKRNQFNSTAQSIRKFRSEIMFSSRDYGSEMKKVLNCSDFYSLSHCRDLLFHKQEHTFTLPEIETVLEKCNLQFIGFELNNNQIKQQFITLHPEKDALESLSLWHQFELEHVNTFAGMYIFWVQKK